MMKSVLVVVCVGYLGIAGSARAVSNDRCALLTQAEAAAALGAPVNPGEMAISGCQWGEKGGQGFVQIQIAEARYYQRPSKGANMIQGVGLEAYTYTDMDAPHAMAKTAKAVVIVWANGPKATSAQVVGLLKTVVGRVEQE